MFLKLKIISFIVIIWSIKLYSQWFSIEPSGFHSFYTVAFIDYNLALVGTSNGEIFRTSDGGISWQFISQTNMNYLIRMRFNASGVGIVVGSNGTILRSTDRGNNWTQIQSLTNLWLNNVAFITENNIITVGENGIILRSIDGGINWKNISTVTSQFLNGIHFIDSLNGFVVGWNQTLLKTNDGGISWNILNLPITDDYMDICFFDSLKGFIVGKWGNILTTSDGGLNWIFVGNYGRGFKKATIVKENVGWTVGWANLIFKTTDGGHTWAEIYSPVAWQGALEDISFVDENNGMIVGANNVLMKTINGCIPVTLISFSAHCEREVVLLNWSSSTEQNNKGYEIERSLDNDHWDKRGFVEGSGTTAEVSDYSFIDKSEIFEKKYFYRLKQIDFDGGYTYSKEIEVEVNSPLKFELAQNYPNPFNPSTKIRYAIPLLGGDERGGLVTLKIYNVLGNEVATLVNEHKPAGTYEVEFDANNGLPSGVYSYQLKSGDYSSSKKMILVK